MKEVLYGLEEAKEDMDVLVNEIKVKNLKLEKLNEEVLKGKDGFLKENKRMYVLKKWKFKNWKQKTYKRNLINDNLLKEIEKLYVHNKNIFY